MKCEQCNHPSDYIPSTGGVCLNCRNKNLREANGGEPEGTAGWYWGTAFPNSDAGEWVGGRRGPFSTWEAADGHAFDNGYDDEERRRFLVIRWED